MVSTKLPIYSKYEDGGIEMSHPEYLIMSQRISLEWDQIMICEICGSNLVKLLKLDDYVDRK